MDVVVIGGGQAGASLAARLRLEGFDGGIALVCGEPVPPYQRPPLSKAYLLGEMEEDRLYLRPADFYADHGIALHLGRRTETIDRDGRTVVLDDGTRLGWDALALCTGSLPRTLPEAIGGRLGGVHTMRDLTDADALRPELMAGRRLLVVGGGYIGLEAAAVAAKSGLQVTVVEMAERILQRVAAPVTSDFFRRLHERHGVRILEGTGLERLIGEGGRVTGARLANGSEIAVDAVVVGVGIVPDTRLAEAAGLEIENGIRTDLYCRTSDPTIFAAGDCASCLYEGRRIRLESVGNAIDMGETAALNILGRETEYHPKPWFWSDQYECHLQIAGLNVGWTDVHVRGAGDKGQTSHWYYAGARLIAVDAMNDSRAYMVGKRLIDMRKSPEPSVATDPATDLKALLKG